MTTISNKKEFRNESAEIINVIIEISKGSDIKYEYDHTSGILVVDRKLFTAMYYPCNYGFIPNTLEQDGDPTDILVLGNSSLVPLSLVKVIPIGVLLTEDEKGVDAKIISVPVPSIDPSFSKVSDINDVPIYLLDQIKHFFEHYKELEKGKWVKVSGWGSRDKATKKISESIARFKKNA
jgi:inorganic pyrophosphatase